MVSDKEIFDKLRRQQKRTIEVLGRTKVPMNRDRLYKALGITQWGMSIFGRHWVRGKSMADTTADDKKKNETYPSLITLGLIEVVDLDIDGLIEHAYVLTPRGKQVYESVKNEIEITVPD